MNSSISDNSLSGSSKPLSSSTGSSSRRAIDVAGSLRRHWLIAAVAFLVIIAGGVFLLLKKAKPDYESHIVVYL